MHCINRAQRQHKPKEAIGKGTRYSLVLLSSSSLLRRNSTAPRSRKRGMEGGLIRAVGLPLHHINCVRVNLRSPVYSRTTAASVGILNCSAFSAQSQLSQYIHRPCSTKHLNTLAPPTSKSSPSLRPNSSSSTSRAKQLASHLSTGTQRNSNMAPRFGIRKLGPANTLEHRIYLEMDGVPCSPFHDIPLYANDQGTVLNMVVEIPRWTQGKLEVSILSWIRIEKHSISATLFFMSLLITLWLFTDLQRRRLEPYQARYQEGQASLRPQLLSPQGLSVELRCFP